MQDAFAAKLRPGQPHWIDIDVALQNSRDLDVYRWSMAPLCRVDMHEQPDGDSNGIKLSMLAFDGLSIVRNRAYASDLIRDARPSAAAGSTTTSSICFLPPVPRPRSKGEKSRLKLATSSSSI